MTSRWTLSLVLAGVVAGGGSFVASVATRPSDAPAVAEDTATQALLTWLRASDEQRAALRGHDPAFARDLRKLRAELAHQRALLASSLDGAAVAPDAVRARLNDVLATQAAIEHRVMDYLLSVRDHLTPDQRRQLFGLCAEEVRQGRAWRWGRQRGEADSQPEDAGRGPGWRGGGRGPGGYRGGRGATFPS